MNTPTEAETVRAMIDRLDVGQLALIAKAANIAPGELLRRLEQAAR